MSPAASAALLWLFVCVCVSSDLFFVSVNGCYVCLWVQFVHLCMFMWVFYCWFMNAPINHVLVFWRIAYFLFPSLPHPLSCFLYLPLNHTFSLYLLSSLPLFFTSGFSVPISLTLKSAFSPSSFFPHKDTIFLSFLFLSFLCFSPLFWRPLSFIFRLQTVPVKLSLDALLQMSSCQVHDTMKRLGSSSDECSHITAALSCLKSTTERGLPARPASHPWALYNSNYILKDT